MQTLFEPTTEAQIISRLEALTANAQPKWGKMNVSQMLAHCSATLEVFLGDVKLKQSFAGKLFGNIAKKRLLSNKPFGKNLPTAKEFKVTDSKNFDEEKLKLINLVNRFATEGKSVGMPVHPFLGKMPPHEWAEIAYKHLDHHLQQFGV